MRLKWILGLVAVLLVVVAVWFNWNSDSPSETDTIEEAPKDKPKIKQEAESWQLPEDIGSTEEQPKANPESRGDLKPVDPKLEESMKELEKGMQAMMEQAINTLYEPLYDELDLNNSERQEMTKQIQNQTHQKLELAMKIANPNIHAKDILQIQEQQEIQRRQNLENILKNAKTADRVDAFEKTLPQRQANMQARRMLSRYEGHFSAQQLQDANMIISDYLKNVMDPTGTGNKITSEAIQNIRNGNFQKYLMDKTQRELEETKQKLTQTGISRKDAEQILSIGTGKF